MATMHAIAPQLPSTLEELHLHYNHIADRGATLLVNLLTSKVDNMRKLDISGNYSITSNGMRGFVDVIQLPASKFIDLRLLDLFSRVDEDVVIGLIMAMANNTTIKILEFDSTKVSESGRNVTTKILCDTSSIASICNLNHTWQSIVNSHNMIPQDLLSLLVISNNMNKAAVIR